jgi:hypothetical protein
MKRSSLQKKSTKIYLEVFYGIGSRLKKLATNERSSFITQKYKFNKKFVTPGANTKNNFVGAFNPVL